MSIWFAVAAVMLMLCVLCVVCHVHCVLCVWFVRDVCGVWRGVCVVLCGCLYRGFGVVDVHCV